MSESKRMKVERSLLVTEVEGLGTSVEVVVVWLSAECEWLGHTRAAMMT